MKFKKGALVRHKSGGPTLTVAGPVGKDGLVPVEWFVGGTVQRQAFDCQMLKPVRRTGLYAALFVVLVIAVLMVLSFLGLR